MRNLIGLLALGVALSAACPARAQTMSAFTQPPQALSLGSVGAVNIQNVPINTAQALQAPGTQGQGAFGYLTSMFRPKSPSAFPSQVGVSNTPAQGQSPNTNYQKLNWPYANLFNVTGK